jgi:hypothetical protein
MFVIGMLPHVYRLGDVPESDAMSPSLSRRLTTRPCAGNAFAIFNAGFLFLSAIAAGAFTILYIAMPETGEKTAKTAT